MRLSTSITTPERRPHFNFRIAKKFLDKPPVKAVRDDGGKNSIGSIMIHLLKVTGYEFRSMQS